MTIWIGVDPGVSGATVMLSKKEVEICRHKDGEGAIAHFFQEICDRFNFNEEVYAVIEEVHSMPGQGVRSMFTFGRSYGFLLGCLANSSIETTTVRPQVWQKAMGLPKRSRDETKTEFKRRLQAKACQLFPKQKVTMDVADALLLARYCKTINTWYE